eukprot:scaffold81370_cov30-Tisochrysis_lutea.AAC.3
MGAHLHQGWQRHLSDGLALLHLEKPECRAFDVRGRQLDAAMRVKRCERNALELERAELRAPREVQLAERCTLEREGVYAAAAARVQPVQPVRARHDQL